MLLAGFHAFFHVVNGGINGLDGRHMMSAFIMLGFFQMMLCLLQGFQRSLHVRLIVIVIAGDSGNWKAQEPQNNGQRKQPPGEFLHGIDLPRFFRLGGGGGLN